MHTTHQSTYSYIVLFAGLLIVLWILGAVTPPHSARGQNPDPTFALFLPLVQVPGISTPERDWDPRLDQRGAVLIPATVTPGQGYWRLVRGVWYNTEESQGKHHIFVDTLDETGARQTDVPVLITWSSGSETLTTQAKPGEEYAADFAMFSIAPSYKAQPGDNAPADAIDGLGMGEIDDPSHGHHTSYGLVWQWTVATIATPTPSVTPSIIPTTPPTLTATPIITATPTASVTPTPTATPTPTLTFPNAIVSDCTPDNSGSRFGGVVMLDGSPVDDQRVVFSYEIDGPWVTEPAITGPNPPGAYSHIISAGVAKAGNWVAWVVAATGERISAHAEFATDGSGGVCNVATIHFSGP